MDASIYLYSLVSKISYFFIDFGSLRLLSKSKLEPDFRKGAYLFKIRKLFILIFDGI